MSDTATIAVGDAFTKVITTGSIGPPGLPGPSGPPGPRGPSGTPWTNYIDITDPIYGGAGDFDGTTGTDNFQPFIDAIIAAKAAGIGVIFAPPGNYRTSLEIWVADAENIQIIGSGHGITTITIDHSPNVRVFRFLDSTNVGLHSLTLTNKTQGSVREGNPAVEFDGCTVFECSDVEVANTSNQASIYARNNSSFGFIHHNLVHDTLADGIHVSSGCSQIIVEENIVHDTGDDCYAVTSDGGIENSFITISNNHGKNSGANGISVYGGHDISVENNNINQTFLCGIQLYGSYSAMNNITVDSNKIKGGGSYALGGEGVGGYSGGIAVWTDVYFATDNIQITNNKISGGRDNFIRVSEHFSTTKLMGRVQVNDNICNGPVTAGGVGDINGGAGSGGSTQYSSNSTAGILINQAKSAEVSRNTVRQAHGQAIYAPQTSSSLGITDSLVMSDNYSDDCCQGASNIAYEIGTSTEITCTNNTGWDPNNHLTFGISWYGTAGEAFQTFRGNNVYGKPNFAVPGGVLMKNFGYTLAAAGAVTIDAAIGTDCQVTLQANATSSSITQPRQGQLLVISIYQDTTGGRTFVWPSNVKLSGPTPRLTPTPFAVDVFTFRYDGTYWMEISRNMDVGFSRHVVGAAGEPAFLNSWVNLGLEYGSISFWKDSLGIVHLSGVAKNGTANTPIFTLPVGFRPAASILQPAVSGAAYCQIYVAGPGGATPGTVQPVFGVNTYVALDGVTFLAEA